MATIKDDIRFAVDPVAFAEEVLPRIDPDIEKLDAWQEEFLKTRARRVLINAFRQSGKSTLTGILALHRAIYYPRSLVLILAPSLRQAGEFFEKVSTGYSELLGGGLGIEAESDRKLGIKLTNGSRIEALPGTQKSTRGFSKPSLIIIDEAAQIDDALYTGVMPMLTRAKEGGRLLMLSTPYGKRGIFWRLWEKSAIFERVRVPYTDVDWVSPSIIEEARETLLDWEFKQEFLCTFEQNQMAVFDVEDFHAATTDEFDAIILRRSA
jgi:hypothetical protein